MIKETKLDTLLMFIKSHPGCTRKQIREGTGLRPNLLNMYLSSYYGYLEGSYRCKYRSSYRSSNEYSKCPYIMVADYKPAKGRVINSYYLNTWGNQRVERWMDKYVEELI